MTNKQKAYARITISVLQARNLKAADRNGLSDPYVVVTQGKHFETTKTIKENLNPTWNETFVFTPEGNDSAMLIKVRARAGPTEMPETASHHASLGQFLRRRMRSGMPSPSIPLQGRPCDGR